MDGELYERDFYKWTLAQADALRRLAAARPNLTEGLDLPHLIEEVEDLGSEQVHAVTGNLHQVLRHLIYLASQPNDPAAPHWAAEIVTFRRNAARRYLPSMRQRIEPQLDAEWRAARRAASRKLSDALTHLPEACPFTLGELLDQEVELESLNDRLRPIEDG